MSNEQTVKDLYAAFLKGDVPAILERVADDVDWRNDSLSSRECPWNADFSGKAKLPGFFQALAENLDFQAFDLNHFTSSEKQVAVNLRVALTVKRTGKSIDNESVHFWTFNDRGQVTRYRHFNDTAAELEAWRG